jgi:hypothetical protein
MESLNLNALAGSLPTSNLAGAEKELLNNFRGKFLMLFPLAPVVVPRDIDAICHPSGRTQYNNPLSFIPYDLQAGVQLWLCSRLR